MACTCPDYFVDKGESICCLSTLVQKIARKQEFRLEVRKLDLVHTVLLVLFINDVIVAVKFTTVHFFKKNKKAFLTKWQQMYIFENNII